MPEPILILFLHGLMAAALCLPPAALVLMLARRTALEQRWRPAVYRGALWLSGAVLVLNAVMTLVGPDIHRSPEGGFDIGGSLIVALSLSWVCLWTGVALHLLVRRRSRSRSLA
jgi:hypothetical protein